MPRFLSPEWIDALDRSVRELDTSSEGGSDAKVVIEQTVEDGGEPVTYQVVIEHGTARVRSGRDRTPSVTLRTDRSTAQSIARGDLSAQEAFVQGRLRVGGDVRALVQHAGALTVLDAGFAGVRAATDYEDA